MACLFCDIAAGKIPAQVVYQDAHTLAFLDLHPKAPGHMLVIPKQHAATILELADFELGPLLLTVKKITGILSEALHPDSMTIGINHAEERGIKHVHFHLMPRFKDDGGLVLQSLIDNPGTGSVEEMAQRIKSFIK